METEMIKTVFTPFCDLIISCKPLRFHAEIIIISPRHTHKNRRKATFRVCDLTFVSLSIGPHTRIVREAASINDRTISICILIMISGHILEIAGGKYSY